LDHFKPAADAHAVVLGGRGNNGGAGYVMARYLHNAGFKITVLVLAPFDKISGDALTNLNLIRAMGLEILEVPAEAEWQTHQALLARCDHIIDGIFGTGLNAPVRGLYAQVIQEVNRAKKPVMAIDIPSGLNADTGQIMGTAVKAELTVTFGLPKIGQLLFPGAELVGRLTRIDIGIPKAVTEKIPARYHLTEPNDFSDLLRGNAPDVHKGNRGHLLVLAGSTGKTGAAAMTAVGALRAGAGLVTLGVPKSLNAVLENKLTEAMTAPLPETPEGTLSLAAEETIHQLMEGKTALALGPGLSTNEETTELVRRIVSRCPVAMVIDADGLNALSGHLDALAPVRGQTIVTPHPGEMARLSGMTTGQIQADRIGTAVHFVEKHGCFLVLKGARSLIAEPGGNVFVNPTGNPLLSSGGTGDVLTGLVAGFAARGWPLGKAAVSGAYLHGLAADFLAQDMGAFGLLAGELLEVVPPLTAALARGEWPLDAAPAHADFYQPL
jgi:NAD(P)H-hydrate epimerase